MKRLMVLGLACGLVACSPTDKTPKQVDLESETSKFSYALGMDMGKSLAAIGIELDADAFVDAFRTRLSAGDLRLTDEESRTVLQAMAEKKKAEMAAEKKVLAEKNQKSGNDYLAENKKKNGVTVTASGLQYEVIEAATGAKPTASDVVKVHYRGTVNDGSEFDSSYSRNAPATFPLNGVIKGWTEGVQLMNVGRTYRFIVPSDLAYGVNAPGASGPNAT